MRSANASDVVREKPFSIRAMGRTFGPWNGAIVAGEDVPESLNGRWIAGDEVMYFIISWDLLCQSEMIDR